MNNTRSCKPVQARFSNVVQIQEEPNTTNTRCITFGGNWNRVISDALAQEFRTKQINSISAIAITPRPRKLRSR